MEMEKLCEALKDFPPERAALESFSNRFFQSCVKMIEGNVFRRFRNPLGADNFDSSKPAW